MERAEVIKELKWVRKVNQQILDTDAKEIDVSSAWIAHWNKVVRALDFAIRSLEVDEAYQLEYEKAEEVECVNLEEAIEAIKHAPINFSIESDIDFSKYKKEIQLIICNILSAQEVAIRKLDKIAVKVGKDA